MPKPCAYCGQLLPLTREHVWPSCFLTRVGRTTAHFSQRSGKVHGADYIVGDVCSTCNNTKLNELDTYFCKLYDEYFEEPRDFNSVVELRYDYKLLVRALLKIAFNSARQAGTNPAPFAPYRAAILGDEPLPEQVAVYGELVSPTLVADPREPGGARVQMPTLYRSAVSRINSPSASRLHTRVIAVNSFYFHILLPTAAMSSQEFGGITDEFARLIGGVVRLGATDSRAILRSSPQDGISSIVPHIRANAEQYGAFFDKRRPK